MLYKHNTEKLLGLQDAKIEKVEETEGCIQIYLTIERKVAKCPCCGAATSTVHDYRIQKVKDIPAFGKQVYIFLRKRRYRCSCGKRFQEKNPFLPKYHRMTSRLVSFIINELREVRSYKSVAKATNVSISTVIRIFDLVQYGRPALPEVLSIDEFKGNTGAEKYQCILTDPANGRVLDILPKRHEIHLISYFKDLKRDSVKFFVSDMWKVYTNFACTYFKNAIQIIDKYHFIRQAVWAFEAVRKQEQKRFSDERRRYFKRSKSLLTKRFDSLSDDGKAQVNVMLYASSALNTAHFLKEEFFKVLDANNRSDAVKLMSDWILKAESSGIPAFQKCAKTFLNWQTGILNSFQFPYTNGFTEGCNNKIKVLKRNAYGFRNFRRFRNRILHIFSHQNSIKAVT